MIVYILETEPAFLADKEYGKYRRYLEKRSEKQLLKYFLHFDLVVLGVADILLYSSDISV